MPILPRRMTVLLAVAQHVGGDTRSGARYPTKGWSRHRVLTGVADEGIPAKVAAIVADGSFDTVVVASNGNQEKATATVQEKGQFGLIRVVNLNASNT